MGHQSVRLSQECPVCGAQLTPSTAQSDCPACGSPILGAASTIAHLTPAGRVILQEQVTALDEQLFAAGSGNAETAFNLGCWMSVLLVLVSTALVYFLTGRNWIFALVAVIISSMIALWGIVLISDIARNSALQRSFTQSIGPALDNLAAAKQIEISTVYEAAYTSLAENAPLRKFIPPAPEPNEDYQEE